MIDINKIRNFPLFNFRILIYLKNSRKILTAQVLKGPENIKSYSFDRFNCDYLLVHPLLFMTGLDPNQRFTELNFMKNKSNF